MLRSLALVLGLVWGAQAWAEARPPVFVLNSLDADVSVIDPASFTQIKRIPTGKEPH
ncbi:MAG: YncE family protein, partial [Roseateles sp.]